MANLLSITTLVFFFFNPPSLCSSQTILLPGQSLSPGSCVEPDPTLYYQPVIGILTHPGDGASGRLDNRTGVTNIPASYVKFVESAGARVIPLIYTEPWETTLEITLERNDAGDHFPLFGIVLGFEILSMIISEDRDICERFIVRDQAATLQFTDTSNIQGSVFERFPPELLRKLSIECLAMQNHKYGISPKRLQENDALSSFFKILTTTPDEQGQIYVSTAQGINYPVTCFQWHPQKNPFEWASPNIPHSEDAVQVTQQVANYFIREARKSSNRPPAQKVRDNLIYNYPPDLQRQGRKGL